VLRLYFLYSRLLLVLKALMHILCLLSLFLLLLLSFAFSDVNGHLHSLQQGVDFIGGQ
jgi:hypothetical protein